jgi:hypothetical protein
MPKLLVSPRESLVEKLKSASRHETAKSIRKSCNAPRQPFPLAQRREQPAEPSSLHCAAASNPSWQ